MLKQSGVLKRGKPLQSRTMLRSGTKKLSSGTKRLKAYQDPDEKRADKGMSEFVINRDGKCVRCGCISGLTCSHFHGRTHSATRFLPENLDALCKWCHDIWEKQKKPGQEYFEWKRKQLGDLEFAILEEKAYLIYPRSLAIQEALKFLSQQILLAQLS